MFTTLRLILVAALAAVLIAPLAGAQGGPGEKIVTVGPAYWDSDAPGSCVDINSLNTFPKEVGAGVSIWVYAPNVYWPPNIKYAAFELYGNTLHNNLTFDSAIGYDGLGDTVSTEFRGKQELQDPSGVRFMVEFNPQPDCEMIKITNTGGVPVTIDSAIVKAHCRVPSLTNWGLLVLLVLLVLSGIYVIYQRRKGVVRA